MNISKKRIAVSVITAFVMVFTLIPYLGGAADVNAATANSFVTNTPEITNANGNAAYEYSFTADNTNKLYIRAERKYFTGSESGADFGIKILDSSSKVIASANTGSGLLELNVKQFPGKDNYKMVLYSGQNQMGSTTYQIEFKLGTVHQYTYKYKSFSAKWYNWYEGSYYQAPDYYVKLSIGKYDGDDKLNQAIYRENVATGKISLPKISDGYDENVAMGAKYKYYIVNKNRLTSAAKSKLPTGTAAKAIGSTAKSELAKKANTATVTIPGPAVKKVTSLKNTKKGIRSATIKWWYSSKTAKDATASATGYEIKVFNSKGKVVGTTYASAGNIGTKVYIPYAGTSKIRVRAYYNYNGNAYYGTPQTISVTSAKITAPSMNVTKISGTKSKITAYKVAGSTGTQVQQKKGDKWVNIATAATAKNYKKTWTQNKAGTSKYRARSYIKDAGKTYYSGWKVYSPQVNQRVYTDYGLGYYRNSYDKNTFWHPVKTYYSGGKIKLKGKFTNSWSIIDASCKVKVTFKADGKVIGTKTISSGNMGPGSGKYVTVTLDNSKSGADLRTASYSVSYLKR